jgi:hypothetical protein
MNKENVVTIPHLAILKDHLTFRDGMGSDSVRPVAMALEQLPYCLSNSYRAVRNLNEITRQLAAVHDAEVTTPGIFLWLAEEERDLLGFEIDSFLESAVRAQNALIPYMRRALRCSMPNSLNGTMKNFVLGKLKISPELTDQLTQYWDNSGKKLREYRDLSQHYALVSSECTLYRGATGVLGISLTLPNNPDMKNIQGLKFTNPIIQALPYILNALIKLIAISYRITDMLLPQGIDRTATPETWILRDATLSSISTGHNIPEEGMVEKEIANCLERQENWHVKRLNASGTAT